MTASPRHRKAIFLAIAVSVSAFASAQHPAMPALSSNPGARYTIFLNFAGFNYPGTWGGRTPGNVPAYTTDADATTFSATELNNIKESWARVASAYVGFNINVTTVDPAASGLTDAQRLAFYDNTQYLTHTIIGGSYNWYGAAGGVSNVGIAQLPTTTGGRRTNWIFPVNGSGTAPKTMSAAIIHEDGHHLRLNHQHDENTGGEYSTNNGVSGNGTYAPIMGASYYSQRGTWRVGQTGTNGNDVARLQGNTNIGALRDSGNGHTTATATEIIANANGTLNTSFNKGWIMPKASTGYSAVGESSYTTDFFTFQSAGGMVSLTANDGSNFLQNGVADPGATMRSVLRIIDSGGSVIGTATEDATTLRHTWSGNLAAGRYYAQVASYGAYISSYEPNSRYFNMGAYFLTGSGIAAVPEPETIMSLMAGIAAMIRRRRKSS